MEEKNVGLLIFGIILLTIGLAASFYYQATFLFGVEIHRTYPYQNLGLVLTVVGISFAAVSFFYKPRKPTL